MAMWAHAGLDYIDLYYLHRIPPQVRNKHRTQLTRIKAPILLAPNPLLSLPLAGGGRIHGLVQAARCCWQDQAGTPPGGTAANIPA
jgi:hypothetical protein